MKKLTFLALAAIATIMFSGCGNSTPKANLNSEIDSVSYAIGLAQSTGLDQFLLERFGVDSTMQEEFLKGLNDGISAGDDKKEAAYYAGVQIGQQIANQMVKGINHELFGEDSTKTISMKNFMAGFVTGYTNKPGIMTQEEAQTFVQQKMEAIKAKAMEEQYGQNKKAGETFLAKNRTAEGVKTLPCGVQYKVIKQGSGNCAKDTSKVVVNYEGKLIDGTVFDSSYTRGQPATLRANQVIRGWTEILKIMPAGSIYEVYIPQQLAYGAREMGNIKPFSALIFKMELISVDK